MALSTNIHLIPSDLQPDERVLPRAEIEQMFGHTLPRVIEDLLPLSGAPTSFAENVRIKVIERNQMTVEPSKHIFPTHKTLF